MADESVAQPVVPAAAPAAAPSVATPAPAAAPEPAPAPEAKASTVLGGDAPAESVPEKPADAAKPAEGEAKDVKDAKPEGEKADGEPKKEEGNQSDEPAPLPSYESFTMPEGFTPDAERLVDFTKELGEFEATTKADHAAVQAFGQKLVDRHIAEVKSAVERVQADARKYWEKQTNDWKQEFINDPEIGGNRQDTTVRSAVEAIRRFGGTPEQQQGLRKLMDDTGLGNSPALIRLLANVNTAKAEGKPIPATAPVADKKTKLEKMYGPKKA